LFHKNGILFAWEHWIRLRSRRLGQLVLSKQFGELIIGERCQLTNLAPTKGQTMK
jgi:hypothetical protein